MRKKSHISVAKGCISGLDIRNRIGHRFTFYVGSILPDCTPSFLTRRHCIDDTFELLGKEMTKFVRKFNEKRDMGYLSTLRMGVVLHYIADYFTFPHNSYYPGGFKDHCAYEEKLKHCMYGFIKEYKPARISENVDVMSTTDQIKQYIIDKHSQYKEIEGNVDSDCSFSLLTCMSVMASLLEIVKNKKEVPAVCAG